MESRRCFFYFKNMKFEKMQAAGNDYIYVNLFEEKVDNPAVLSKKLSNRNFGVGSDGLVLIGPSDIGDYFMHMFNADGSEGMMCGNAARCVGKYLYERGLTKNREIDLNTKSGIKHLSLYVSGKSNTVDLIKVDMGTPDMYHFSLNSMIDYPVTIGDHTYKITYVSMGNPHAVIFVNDIENLEIEKIGPMIEFLDYFPDRANVEFVEVVDLDNLKIRVWERGSGETLACGSGACAAVVAGVVTGRSGLIVSVSLKGGVLEVEWDKTTNQVYLTGDAHFVFKGEAY